MIFKDSPHRRYNPLNGEWIIVSPQRSKRPWQAAAAKEATKMEDYDAKCFLCPGNQRSSLDDKTIQNPDYEDIFVFENDFPCLIDDGSMQPHDEDTNDSNISKHNFFKHQDIRGTCRVICYSKHHNLNLGDMPDASILNVINEWINQLQELGQKYAYVQIFESKGELVGCSSQHPHGQIWALDYIPHLVEQENKRQQSYNEQYNSNLLLDYLSEEELLGERIVMANDHWVVLVPYWAYWPYET
ncbi:MAG: galactose-1-phosphate uridylyltransferase, partial [Candidatus Portiera sp.]|nr:galactose-1-phosphate uridylyltransferase [Portiera sp.]